MAAGVSEWLKLHWPEIEIIGVEGIGQASMKAALAAGTPTPLAEVDLFCDGTAVRQAGALPFEICRDTLARVETVTNAEVSQAIRVMWECLRCISEPAGAMGLAAVLKNRADLAGKRVLIILCGANIDFLQLGLIAQSTAAAGQSSRTLRVRMAERPGTMLELLDSCLAGLDIADFQYGKASETTAWPTFTIRTSDAALLAALPKRLEQSGFAWEDVTGAEDITFRAIPLRGDLLHHPAFLRLDFYERPGALHDFLHHHLRGQAGICYFNYRNTGERIGRALIGLDFPTAAARDSLLASIPPHGDGYRRCQVIDDPTSRRITGRE